MPIKLNIAMVANYKTKTKKLSTNSEDISHRSLKIKHKQ